MKKRIILVDPITGGHNAFYLTLLTRSFIKKGAQVDIISGDKDETQLFLEKYISDSISGTKVIELNITKKDIKLPVGRLNQLATVSYIWYKTFRRIQRLERKYDIKYDMVFIAWLEFYIKYFTTNIYVNKYLPRIIKFLTHRPWSGIYFHPRYLRRPEKYPMLERDGTSVSRLFTETGCRMLFTLDEGIRDKLAKDLEPVPVRWLPDIPLTWRCDYDWPVLDNIKQQAGDKLTILLTGVLNRFKGVEEFIELATKPEFKEYFFVLAGRLNIDRLSAEVRKKIKSRAIPNLYVYPEFIPTEEQMNALIATSDMIYLHYKKFTHSSSLQVKAAKLETPAIVINDHLIRERAEEWGGSLILDHTSELTPQKLEKLLETEYKRDTKLESFNFQQFSQKIGRVVSSQKDEK